MTESSRSSSEASSSGSVPARLTDTADGLQALYSRLWRSWSVMEYCSSFRADFSEADMRLLVTAVQQLTKAGDELGRLVRAAVPSPLADPQMARGIRMLGVLPSEHPHAAVYNEALELAAAYVEKVWCQPGRGANAQREDRAAVPSPQPSSVPPPVALPVIPRYRMTRPAVLFHDDGSMAVRPVDDPAGAWVRAEDAERAIAEAREPPPFDYVAVLKDAKQIVNNSVLYRRFIDGTPLENDIAVWMADFALKVAESRFAGKE